MVETHLSAEKMHLLEPNTKVSMKIDPYCQRQDGRRTGEKQRKLIFFLQNATSVLKYFEFYYSNDTKAGDNERHLRLLNVRKLHIGHVCGTHIVRVVLSELIVSIRL